MEFASFSKTLAHNLRAYRAEKGFTQNEVAKKSGISFRLYQQLESGTSNPTLQSVHALACTFEISAAQLLSLRSTRTELSAEAFVEKFAQAFENLPLGACIRTHEGVVTYYNPTAARAFGQDPTSPRNPISLLEMHTGASRETLRAQLTAEKNGLAFPYINTWVDSKTGEKFILRFFPCLILPSKGTTPYYSAVYFADATHDTQNEYYRFCSKLLNAAQSLVLVIASSFPTEAIYFI